MVIGWGRKVKALGVGPTLECPNCGNTKRWVTAKAHRYFSVMFVPILRWGSQYMMVCPLCERGVQLESAGEATQMLLDQLAPLLDAEGANAEEFKTRSSDPAFLDHATSLSWPIVLNIQLMGHELGEAEAIGVAAEEQPHWSTNVVAAVRREIGELDLIRALILETAGAQGDAAFETAIERFFESSGYLAARKRLFPELYGPAPEAARIGVEPHPALMKELLDSATDAVAAASEDPTDGGKYQSAQLAVLSYLGLCAWSQKDEVNRLMKALLADDKPVADPVGLARLSDALVEVSNAGHSSDIAVEMLITFQT